MENWGDRAFKRPLKLPQSYQSFNLICPDQYHYSLDSRYKCAIRISPLGRLIQNVRLLEDEHTILSRIRYPDIEAVNLVDTVQVYMIQYSQFQAMVPQETNLK